jgi:nucleoid-associated protein YgaU
MCSSLDGRTPVRQNTGVARTRVRPLGALALAAAAAAAVLAAGRAAGSAEQIPQGRAERYVRHVIRPGDTLWELARLRVGAEGDPRPLIEALRRLNGLGTHSLQPGATILIPPAP